MNIPLGSAVRAILLESLCAGILLGQVATPRSQGVHPRGTATDYAAHVKNGQIEIAGSVLSAEQVKHTFAYDISNSYVVVEVALYPIDKPLDAGAATFRNGDFTMELASTGGDQVLAAEPETVAAVIQQKNSPRPAGQTVPVYAEVNVGVESGTDPYSGRRVHNIYTGGGVGVGGPSYPQYPAPGGYPQDRALLEEQLWRRSLPEGAVTSPIAGYLYFPSALLKREKKNYRLVLVGNHAQAGASSQKLELALPVKSK